MTTEQRARTAANPFPGLRPFETDEYRLFFGREGQSDALVERLERSRFLAIVGTSGSGKSSLVRAGLLPALRGGMMAGAGSGWRVAVLRPGHDPVGNLAQALAEDGVLAEAGAGLPRAEAEAVIEATLRRGSLGLVEAAARARMREREKLLVVVDQFEELFRFRAARAAAGSTDDDASAFVKLLLEAARQREVPLYVVLTMRSDFLGDCAQFQGLPEAINDGQYLIPRMTRDERRFAIVGPVRVARARMTEPLVNRLLNDVGDNPDQLPILQHALMRTWDYWAGHRRDSEPLGLEHYEAVGAMADALSLHADEAWGELHDERSRRVAELLFKALTERGADNRETRRPTRLKEICEIADATPEEVAAVVEVFRREGRSFLMPPADVPLTPDTVIDISHESLIRNWERLRAWVRDEAEAARIYRRLAEAAAAYRAGEGGLLDDVTLGWVNRWRERYSPNRAWGVRYHPGYEEAMAYLEESRAARDDRIAAEGERERRELEQARAYADQQHRANRKLRVMMLALAAMLLLALATAGYAWSVSSTVIRKQAEVERQRALAEQQKAIAEQQRNEITELLRKTEQQRKENASLFNEQKEINKRLVEAEKKRKEALLDAQEKARVAAASARKARAAETAAKLLLAANKSAREANEMFRQGVVSMQRRDYDTANSLLTDVFEDYNGPAVNNPGAAADSRVQRGNMHYAVARDLFAKAHGNFRYDGPMHRLDAFQHDYEEAAGIYAGPKVNSPYRAGATLYALALQLLQFTNETPAAGDRADDATDARRSPFRLGEEPPGFGPDMRLRYDDSGPLLDLDAKVQFDAKRALRERAVELYRRSLDFFGSTAMKGSPEESMAGEWKMKTALQLGNLYLYEANEALAQGADKAQADVYRREALAYFEPLVSDKSNDHMRDVQSRLAWVGGLYFEMGGCSARERQESEECRAAESYFGRVWQRNKDSAEGLRHVAELADKAGMLAAAESLYSRALERYRAEGAEPHAFYDNLLQQAQMLYALGRVDEEESGAESFDRAVARYREAVDKFRLAFNRPNSEGKPEDATTSPEDLLHVGEMAGGVNDYALARDAYELLVQYGTRHVRYYKKYKARALAELGSVYTLMGEPARALEAYQQAAAAYREIAADSSAPELHEEADEAAERARKAGAALKAAVQKPR